MPTGPVATHAPQVAANGYDVAPTKPQSKERPKHWRANTRIGPDKLDEFITQHGAGNLAIRAGDDLVIIDADIDVPAAAAPIENAIKSLAPQTWVGRSGRDGHAAYWFRLGAGVEPKPIAYFDTIGASASVEMHTGNKAVIAYGSVQSTGITYRWMSGRNLENTPKDQLPVLTAEGYATLAAACEQVATNIGLTLNAPRMREVESPVSQASPDMAAHFLSFLPNTDYTLWIDVGMALHGTSDGDPAFLAVWETWSQTAANHTPGACAAKWDGFGRSETPMTLGSVFQRYLTRAELVLPCALARFVYIQGTAKIADVQTRRTPVVMSSANFREYLGNLPDIQMGKGDRRPVAEAWLKSGRRRDVRDLAYHPSSDLIVRLDGDDYVNTCRLAQHTPNATHTSERFVQHLRYLCPEPGDAEWLLSWLAFSVQRPEMRCKVAPLHVSIAHGTGRGWLIELLGKLLGSRNTTRASLANFASGFNGFLVDSVVCVIDEAREDDPDARYSSRQMASLEDIGDAITEPELYINRKYGAAEKARIYSNVMILTNRPNAIKIGARDRRVQVLWGPETPQTPAYYHALYAVLDDPNEIAAIYNTLMRLDISGFDWQRASMTAAKLSMVQAGLDDIDTRIAALLEQPPYQMMTTSAIRQAAQLPDTISNRGIGNKLSALGKRMWAGPSGNGRLLVDKSPHRLWVLANEAHSMSKDMAMAILHSQIATYGTISPGGTTHTFQQPTLGAAPAPHIVRPE